MPTSGGPYYIYYFCCGTFTKLGSSPAFAPQTSKSKGTAASDLLAFAISEDYLSSDHRASDALSAASSEATAHALVSAVTTVITVTLPSTALPGEFISGAWTSTQYSQEDDWIGIMRVGDVPQRSSALWWDYVPAPTLLHAVFITSAVTQTAEWITPSHGGPFVAYYFCCDSDAPLAQSNTLSLLVPVTAPTMPSVVTLPSHVLGRVYVTGSWYRPALSLGYDWVGLFRTAQNPVTDYPLWWAYVPGGGLSQANFSTSDNSEVRSWKTPAAGGSFVAVYFCCDSRTIEAKSNVMIVNGTAPATKPIYLPVVNSGDRLKARIFEISKNLCCNFNDYECTVYSNTHLSLTFTLIVIVVLIFIKFRNCEYLARLYFNMNVLFRRRLESHRSKEHRFRKFHCGGMDIRSNFLHRIRGARLDRFVPRGRSSRLRGLDMVESDSSRTDRGLLHYSGL